MSNDPDQSITPEILEHYAEGVERDRLFRGRSQLEQVRTREILGRHLPTAPATVLDVGGGPGVYACWLAEQGYEVHLVDPVPLHVEQALQAAEQRADCQLASAQIGDARALHQPSSSVDAVLLLGPLYHLTDRADRLRALQEARRCVRPGGRVFVVGISRFTSLLDGISSNFFDDPEFVQIVEQDLENGQHRNPSNKPGYFTTAFFHHPVELRAEVEEADLVVEDMVGIEGPGNWMTADFPAWWENPTRRERLLAAIRAVESEPSLLGLGPHFMVVARRG